MKGRSEGDQTKNGINLTRSFARGRMGKQNLCSSDILAASMRRSETLQLGYCQSSPRLPASLETASSASGVDHTVLCSVTCAKPMLGCSTEVAGVSPRSIKTKNYRSPQLFILPNLSFRCRHLLFLFLRHQIDRWRSCDALQVGDFAQ